MRVIRPARLSAAHRRRALAVAGALVGTGILAAVGAALDLTGSAAATAGLAVLAAAGIGIGSARLLGVLRPNRSRDLGNALAGILAPTLDDSYTLLVAPRLPVRDTMRLDGILVGPAGVRAFTARDWEGRYRVRGRVWDFDGGRRGWIRCRTNPSFDAVSLAEGVARWAADRDLGDPPIRGAVAFPLRRSRIVLEEPVDEIVTGDNGPWWANAIGRVQRLDPASAARFVEAVLAASEAAAEVRGPQTGTGVPNRSA